MIRKLLGRVVCRFRGHLRGKLVHKDQGRKVFACPRCERSTSYPIRAAK